MKKLIATLLALCMILSILPATALAAEPIGSDSDLDIGQEVSEWPENIPGENSEDASDVHQDEMSDGLSNVDIPEGTDIRDNWYGENGQSPMDFSLYDISDVGSVTRGAWIAELVSLFHMTLTQDEYPDVYFPDIENTAYYDAIMVATKYGLVDVEAGEPFDPGGPLTREYAAYTLNFCLGLQSSGTYTYSDQNDVTYLNDAQVALDNGWFASVGGAFYPQMAVTAEEHTAMMQSAQSILQSRDVSTRMSNFQFASYVKIIPNSAEVITEFDPDTGARTLTIYGYDGILSTGDTFAYYYEDFAFVFLAQAVSDAGGILTVVTAEPPEGAVLQYEYTGSLTPEITAFVPDNEPVTLMEADGTAVTFGAVRDFEIDLKKREIKLTRDIFKSNGVKGTLSGKITADRLDINIKGDNKYAKLVGRIEIASTVEFDALNDPAARGLLLGGLQLGSFGYVGIELSLKMEVRISYTYNAEYEFGVQYAYGRGSIIRDFHANGDSNCISADGTVSVQLSLAVYVDLGPAGYARGSIGAGPIINAGYKRYGSGLPSQCFSLTGYFYAGITCSIDIKDPITNRSLFKPNPYKYDFYNEYNSPIRVYKHAEDGVEVWSCTRGNDPGTTSGSYTTSRYSTPSNSRYYVSGSSSGSSSGLGTGGTVVPIWTIKANSDGRTAEVTGYSGGGSVLSIPETIDGYTITSIGYGAFRNNANIRVVTMPDAVTEINGSAFEGCTNLQTVDFSENLVSISAYAFKGCASLTEADLPEGLETLGKSYFGTTSYIRGGVFADCSSLERVYIPASLETGVGMTKGNFENCPKLSAVTFGEGIPIIPDHLFYNCKSLTHIEIPDTVTEIGQNAFRSCTGLTSIKIPDAVIEIGAFAFDSCTNLQTVDFSESLITIYTCAFRGCSSLAKISLPEGLETLGKSSWSGANNFSGSVFEGCTSLEQVYIPASLQTGSGTNNFANCPKLDSIIFGEGIPTIPDYLFCGCSSLTHIEIPETVTTYGKNCFYGCSSLATVKLSDNALIIPDSMFYGCSILETVDFPAGLTKIGNQVFTNCASLKIVDLPDSTTTLGSSVFKGCSSLTTLKTGAGLTEIGYNCFQECVKLTDVTLNDGLVTLRDYAFQNCKALQTIVLPDTVTSMGIYVFQACAALTDVTLSNRLTTIPSYAFANCSSLVSIELPKGVTAISANAFYQDTKLTEITIPQTVTSIGSQAFSYATKMTVYGCSGSYAEEWATTNRSKFVDITVGITALSLANGTDLMTIGTSQTVTPMFTTTPANTTDIITLSSDNTSIVSVSNSTALRGVRAGTANITATASSGVTYTFVVTVASFTGIEIGRLPNITSYGLKDDMNLDGLVVNAVFANGSKEAVSGYTVKGFDTDTTGVKTVTVTYANKTATFDITVAKVETGVMTNPTNGKTVNWSYNDVAQTVTISGTIPQGEQVCVARYGEGGRFLGMETVQKSRSIDVSQGEEIQLIWVIIDTYVPVCESKKISK